MTSAIGVIETIRVRDGALPLLDRHLARLTRSLAALGQRQPDRDPTALVRPFADMGDAAIRLEVIDGRVSVTVRGVASEIPPSVVVAAEPHVAYPHKITSRRAFEIAAAEARAAGAADALLLTREGRVAEGTVWSVCWWEADRVRTPGLGMGVLPGIGRARVRELVSMEEGEFALADLDGRSLFLVNAVRGVVPLASLAGRDVPPDPRTRELSQRFWPD